MTGLPIADHARAAAAGLGGVTAAAEVAAWIARDPESYGPMMRKAARMAEGRQAVQAAAACVAAGHPPPAWLATEHRPTPDVAAGVADVEIPWAPPADARLRDEQPW